VCRLEIVETSVHSVTPSVGIGALRRIYHLYPLAIGPTWVARTVTAETMAFRTCIETP
jgi:hypothetical protein